MERESFIFYRSFYEAIKCMPQDVQAEIYPALMEYALFGKTPKNLSDLAKGIFILIKPNIDTNTTRYENGKKGGRKRSVKPSTDNSPTVSDEPTEVYSQTFIQETAVMKSDAIWLEGVAKNYHISLNDLKSRLDKFLLHCNSELSDKSHTSIGDAKRHFLAWMRKIYPVSDNYDYNGGFGGLDT